MLARQIARLPPVWAVVVLFVGLTLPQALLGLPIAAAGIGALPALAIVVVVGALMTLASAAEAEAIVRDREFREGGGYFGRIVERPWSVDGKVGVAPLVHVTLSADHRATDGHRGALLLDAIDVLLQKPEDL